MAAQRSLALCLKSYKNIFKVPQLCWNVLTKGSSVAISLAIFLNSYPACIPSLVFLETGYLRKKRRSRIKAGQRLKWALGLTLGCPVGTYKDRRGPWKWGSLRCAHSSLNESVCQEWVFTMHGSALQDFKDLQGFLFLWQIPLKEAPVEDWREAACKHFCSYFLCLINKSAAPEVHSGFNQSEVKSVWGGWMWVYVRGGWLAWGRWCWMLPFVGIILCFHHNTSKPCFINSIHV